MRTGSGAMGALLIAAVVIVGCGAVPDAEAGLGLGELSPREAREAFASAAAQPNDMQGSFAVDDRGCFVWTGDVGEGAWIVWPDQFELGPGEGAQIMIEDGDPIDSGDHLLVTGALVSPADLPGGSNPDSYFSSYAEFCEAGQRGVLILTEVTKAS